MTYQLTWITSQLAAGYAPMSYEDLDTIKKQGINAIVNLCGEFTDLHEIEEKAGFEVCYLPTPDEHAPEITAMEKALEWLDEAIYLKKKVLVHCRHGHGRTGTFISAYLLRRGLGLKKAEKILKNTRANPTNFSQWRLLRKYNKQEGILTLKEAEAETSASGPDLTPFLHEYEAIANELDLELAPWKKENSCGQSETDCCQHYFELGLAESVWIHTNLNKLLSQDDRQEAIERAVDCAAVIKTVQTLHRFHPRLQDEEFAVTYAATRTTCPLSIGGKCILYDKRPFRCRWYTDVETGNGFPQEHRDQYTEMLVNISHNMYLALTGVFPPEGVLQFTMAETVSGRFVQACFTAMLNGNKG
jgi:protein-tyrosine phosphatase